ncbi:MAG: hypothetical protein KF866_03375 [Phycisphaeraceae bacterium]|nr:hypothetical protein [Phycisphaeraceae bacterium]MCW5753263.1 hypothetical protein [Phycisphaeraceae bacterium]
MPTRTRPVADLVTHALTILAGIAVIVIAVVSPDHFHHLARKDAFRDTGLFEHLTVAVLIPGIIAGIYALVRYRRRLPRLYLQGYLALWILACIYFAGEEASWGQWYFGWETPPALAEVNKQEETNIHNISSWLNQKPRAMVELFITFVGLLVPAVIYLVTRATPSPRAPAAWILAPGICWSAAFFHTLFRVCSFIDNPLAQRLGSSELRELAVAWFLAIYLWSFALRLRRVRPGAT